MQERMILARFAVIPLPHKLIAAGIALGIAGGCLFWARHLPQEYVSTAVLSFDRTAAKNYATPRQPGGQIHAKDLAQSILSDSVLAVLGKQLDPSAGKSPQREAERLRSRLELTEPEPTKLQVAWRGANRRHAAAVTNAVANLLAAWVPVETELPAVPAPVPISSPAPQPAPSDNAVTTDQVNSLSAADRQTALRRLRVKREELSDDLVDLEQQREDTDRKLSALDAERRKLEQGIQSDSATRAHQNAARQPLEKQLAAAKKKLEDLRARYTDEYPDVQAVKEQIADLEKDLAATSAAPAPTGQPRLDAIAKESGALRLRRVRIMEQLKEDNKTDAGLRQSERTIAFVAAPAEPTAPEPAPVVVPHPVVADPVGGSDQTWRSVFTLVQSAENTEATTDRRDELRWLGIAGGLFFGALYLALALRWFRVVRNVSMLEHILPADIVYLGAIPGIKR
jgi:predicted  nucleic acid-binding Zn-ribbon protein